VLVPRAEGRLMTACSFGSRKWPHWSDPDTMVLRVSAGRAGDDRPFQLDDDALVDRLHTEVAQALGPAASPSASRVSRWPGAFPQYEVGHIGRVARIEAALRRTLPNVALAGASYRGSGIPACIASGRVAATSMLPPPGDGET
jgi:oxygen-dependent protoporphyrinogen oxidase